MNESFEQYYQAVYGARWEALRAALLAPAPKVARVTARGRAEEVQLQDASEVVTGCLLPGVDADNDAALGAEGCFYHMDLGSVLAARSLKAFPGQEVWDACAAPGGKTLILLEALEGDGSLIATDLSRARCERLKAVVRAHATPALQSIFRVHTADAVDYGYRHQSRFDAVLLDAPCSSERHVLQDSSALAQWSPARIKSLRQRQYALLCSALLACKPGGRVVYATCSINPEENDGILDRVVAKKGDTFTIVRESEACGEATAFGWQIHPDMHDGWGPIYRSVLVKT